MTDKKVPVREGYQPPPERVDKGYQPDTPAPNSPEPNSGYQPPTSDGDSPANEPAPPSEE